MTEPTEPTPDPYQLNAYQLRQVTKVIDALNELSRETGVDLCSLGEGHLGIDGVDIRYRSTGSGRETQYCLDFRQH